MARLPYIDPRSASPQVLEALEGLPQLNIFRMLAHADSAFLPYLGLAGTLLAQLELDPKLRELAILLVARRCGAEYEWIQHTGISRAIGLTEEQITAVQENDLRAACLDPNAQAVLGFTAAVLEQPRAEDLVFAVRREPILRAANGSHTVDAWGAFLVDLKREHHH